MSIGTQRTSVGFFDVSVNRRVDSATTYKRPTEMGSSGVRLGIFTDRQFLPNLSSGTTRNLTSSSALYLKYVILQK